MLSYCCQRNGDRIQAKTFAELAEQRQRARDSTKSSCNNTAGLVVGITLIIISLLAVAVVLTSIPDYPAIAELRHVVKFLAAQTGCPSLHVTLWGIGIGGAITLVSLILPLCCKKSR